MERMITEALIHTSLIIMPFSGPFWGLQRQVVITGVIVKEANVAVSTSKVPLYDQRECYNFYNGSEMFYWRIAVIFSLTWIWNASCDHFSQLGSNNVGIAQGETKPTIRLQIIKSISDFICPWKPCPISPKFPEIPFPGVGMLFGWGL